jgi:hypothetical protein
MDGAKHPALLLVDTISSLVQLIIVITIGK